MTEKNFSSAFKETKVEAYDRVCQANGTSWKKRSMISMKSCRGFRAKRRKLLFLLKQTKAENEDSSFYLGKHILDLQLILCIREGNFAEQSKASSWHLGYLSQQCFY